MAKQTRKDVGEKEPTAPVKDAGNAIESIFAEKKAVKAVPAKAVEVKSPKLSTKPPPAPGDDGLEDLASVQSRVRAAKAIRPKVSAPLIDDDFADIRGIKKRKQ